MRKGEKTRDSVVQAVAPIFNQKGFAGTSMADVMEATGLQKGGIYNHFRSKDDIAIQAFDYSLALIRERLDKALEAKESATDRLTGIAGVFADHILYPIIPGGCPLLNTAVESDDTHPALLDRARDGFERWHTLIRGTVRKGIARGEFRADVDTEEFATSFIALLEGGIMLSRVYGDRLQMDRTMRCMERLTDGLKP